MATARVFEERIGEKTAKAECTASRITIIIAASARLALSGAWRRRKYQFSPVPSKNASEVASKGPRKAPRACGVRSRKCPMESAYSCGFFFSSSARSVPGAGAFDKKRKNIPAAKAAMPIARRNAAEILPARREDFCCVSSGNRRSEEHTSELQSRENLVCRLLLEKKNRTEGAH